jgi:predicted phosphodiesterase
VYVIIGGMKIAAITDIHGNLPALNAVLADIKKADIDLLVNLGDILAGPLWPAQTADLLMPMNLPTISGNHERQVLTFDKDDMGAPDRYTHDMLDLRHRDWMAALPETLQLTKDVFLCHGTPDSDLIYLLEDFSDGGVVEADHGLIRERLAGCDAPVVLCGHTHVQHQVVLDNGQMIVNPGSVGLPAFDDLLPVRHKIEAGTPHARYAIISGEDGGTWSAELKAVDYDWESAAAQAEKNASPDWAKALRTGFA